MPLIFKCKMLVVLLVYCLHFAKAQDYCEIYNTNTVQCSSTDLKTVQDFLSNTTGDVIEELDLFYCYIDTYDGETIPEPTASSLKALRIVTQSKTSFMLDFLTNFTQLETLRINAYIKKMSPGFFNPARNLKTITLLTDSRNLDVGLFADLTNVEHIYYDSKITKLVAGSFQHLPSLFDITLSPFSLKTIEIGAFDNLPSLRKLTIQNSKLTKLKSGTFSNLPMLYIVDISGNNIFDIEPGTFENSTAIEYLDINANKLTDVNGDWFDDMPKLVEIKLSQNLLKDLNVSALAETISAYTVIYLEQNPWICSNLPKIVDDFTQTNLLPYWGDLSNDTTNYNGIPCTNF